MTTTQPPPWPGISGEKLVHLAHPRAVWHLEDTAAVLATARWALAAREVLMDIRDLSEAEGLPFCPTCLDVYAGHTPDCQLAQLLHERT